MVTLNLPPKHHFQTIQDLSHNFSGFWSNAIFSKRSALHSLGFSTVFSPHLVFLFTASITLSPAYIWRVLLLRQALLRLNIAALGSNVCSACSKPLPPLSTSQDSPVGAVHGICTITAHSQSSLFTLWTFFLDLKCTCSVMSESLWPHGLEPARALSMGFPRQEYWNGLPFPSPGDLPHPGIEPVSPELAGKFFKHCATWEAHISVCVCACGCGCVCTRACSVAQLCPPLCDHMDCSQGTPKTINANAAAFLQHLSVQFSTTPRHVFHLLSRIPVPHVTQYWHGAPPVPGPFLWSPPSSSHSSSTNTEQADPNLDTYLI